jgi:voltage-gated potassium channel
MGVLALVTVATLFTDAAWAWTLNWAIYAVFVLDVSVRFARAEDRRGFPRRNWPDLVALVPFELLRPFRTVRLLRLVRLLRVVRLGARVGPTTRGILRQNGLQYVLVFVAILIVVGGTSAWLLEDDIATLGDGIWWAIVTTTTVGYGDLSPNDVPGRAIAVVLMLAGIGTLGMVTGSIATYFSHLGDDRDIPDEVRHVQERLSHWHELDPGERRRLARTLDERADRDPTSAG